jgi:hypothetical protein
LKTRTFVARQKNLKTETLDRVDPVVLND